MPLKEPQSVPKVAPMRSSSKTGPSVPSGSMAWQPNNKSFNLTVTTPDSAHHAEQVVQFFPDFRFAALHGLGDLGLD